MTEFLMGNEAIALGALHAGVSFVSGYPGTPSTEILETVAKRGGGRLYVEWSVNEKAALEAAAGAAMAGARTMVTMKQLGLNVASDPLMSLAYVGVKGGMVVVVADDPGPISSQTEQDTRTFAAYAKLPVFDPASPEEAYGMIADAFALSEKYSTPVLLRPTTRVCHGCATVTLRDDPQEPVLGDGFVKDSARWVIFPRASYLNHLKLEDRTPVLSREFSSYRYNTLTGSGRIGVAAGGVSRSYVMEALKSLGANVRLLSIATPYPFPEDLAREFLDGVDRVIVLEELDPHIERQLITLCGKTGKSVKICGKQDGTVQRAGENSVESVKTVLAGFLGLTLENSTALDTPELPVRPPVLCAGCPHRASFYAVKLAAKGKKAVFSGDIGCYTLGNAKPLDMVDMCLCMGAGITMAQGLHRIEPDAVNFAFVGDSTFFASGLTGVVNAVYNEADIILILLDNATTAMTGGQPHPGTGQTMMGAVSQKISPEAVLRAFGISLVLTADPFDLQASVDAVKTAMAASGVRAVVFRAPCIAVSKPAGLEAVTDKCTGCFKCIREIGCPAVVRREKQAYIEPSLCTGCGLCAQVCPFGAILPAERSKNHGK